MSITHESTWAGLPSTSRGVAIHLSYDKKSDRIAYASNRSVFLQSVENPAKDTIQYINHTCKVTVAKFAPSGFYVASGDEHGNVKVWDCVGEDKVTKGEYQVISGRINDLSWDADSQRIIAVGDGKERHGHCFTADSGNSVGEITGHTDVVNAVAIKPTRPYKAATVGDDGNLVFYNGPPFKFAFKNDKHTNFVQDVKFSPNGEYLVSVGSDKKIVIYEGKTGEPKSTIESGHEGGIFSIAWSEDSSSFVTCSADGSLKLFDTEGKELKTWKLERNLNNQQVGVVFAGEKRIISLALSGDLYYWNVDDTTGPERIVYGHQTAINSIARVNSALYTGGVDGRVCKWENSVSSVLADGHNGQIVDMCDNNKDSVYSVAWDDTIKQIQGDKFTNSTNLEAQPISLGVYNDRSVVVSEDTVTLYNNNGEKGKSTKAEKATAAAISEKHVAVGDYNNNIHLLDSNDLSEICKLPPMRAAPAVLAFDKTGNYLAVGEKNGKVYLYDIESKQIKTTRWAFHTSRITGISWHENGKYVATSSLDTNIYIYSVENPGKNIKVLGAHKDGVNSVTWVNEKTIASVGADAAVKHWSVVLQ